MVREDFLSDQFEPEQLVPPPVAGIQVNFCKNPACGNYCKPASGVKQNPGRPARTAEPNDESPPYKPHTTSDTYTLHCQDCKEYPVVKSNQAIKEELDRLSAYLDTPTFSTLCCPNEECEHHTDDVRRYPNFYYKHGKTVTGSQRYQCKKCKTTFTDVVITSPISRHKKSHKNASIFIDLVNKVPLKATARKNGISMKTLYDKIDFIHKQCVAFAASRESQLPSINRKWMEVAVDRQVHRINWQSHEDKRNVDLFVIASADSRSGYVFGAHFNYDPAFNEEEVEQDAIKCGDYEKDAPFRKYARLWLPRDYVNAAARCEARAERRAQKRKSAQDLVEETYEDAEARTDVESGEVMDSDRQLPPEGMEVHSEYTMYAHFMLLERMLKGVEYVRFYLDQDSGIRAACLTGFATKILAKKCDAFYVKVGKQLSQAQKLGKVRGWQWVRDEFLSKNPGCEEFTDISICRTIIEKMLKDLIPLGKWKDRWLNHPFASMSEPEKMVCYLTNRQKGEFDQKDAYMAMMFDRASLHSIDRFFMQVRRSLATLERAISSSSTSGRRWYGYNAYKPDTAIKLLEIFRVYFNYVQMTEGEKRKRLKEGEKKRKRGEAQKLFKTPAMRLGLAKGQITVEDILYFVEGSEIGKLYQ